jgi:hypothetical protein
LCGVEASRPDKVPDVTSETVARVWFGLTAVVVAAGITVQLFVTAGVERGHFPTVPGRLFNVFCFFTIQSNIILGVTSALLAWRLHRRSLIFRVRVWMESCA